MPLKREEAFLLSFYNPSFFLILYILNQKRFPLKTLFTVFFLFIVTSYSYSQIVNIESKRVRREGDGWSGESGVEFFILKEVSTIYAAAGNIQLQVKKDRSLLLFLSEFSFLKADNQDFSNAGFQHIRFNYKLNDLIRWEAFTQGQFNKVRDIKFRGLLGTGPRVKLYDTEIMRFYLASLYMYEYEERQNERLFDRINRLSSYFSYTFDIGKMLFYGTIYHQPNLADFSDYRIAFQTDLEFEVFEALDFVIRYKLLYDTVPPPGVPNTSYQISNGLILEL